MLLSFGFSQQDSTKKIFINQIGPTINDLPLLDSLMVHSNDSTNFKNKIAIFQPSDIKTYTMKA